MLSSLLQPLKKNSGLITRAAHRAAARVSPPIGRAASPKTKLEASSKSASPVDGYEPPRPAMTSQILGVSLLDMATPASCAAARAIAEHRARAAAQAQLAAKR